MSEPIPAATLILYRESEAGGRPEILMLERGSGLAFAPGALVFPGGRVDPEDHAIAADRTLVAGAILDDAAARIAAIRETVEEVGVAMAIAPAPDPVRTAALRAGLAAGEPFSALLRSHGLHLMLDRLTAFARWQPPGKLVRVFDTRFYLAQVAPGTAAQADGAESLHARWASAASFLAEAEAGRAQLMFPTLCNLQRIATHASFAEAQADAMRHSPRLIVPGREEQDGETWLTVPDGFGYPATRQRLADVERLIRTG